MLVAIIEKQFGIVKIVRVWAWVTTILVSLIFFGRKLKKRW